MAIQMTAIRLSGGTSQEHITHLWWTNPSDNKTGDNTPAQIVIWIETENGHAYVQDARGNRATVAVPS